MVLFKVILNILVGVIFISLIISWFKHILLVLKLCDNYKWGSYLKFKEKFEEEVWFYSKLLYLTIYNVNKTSEISGHGMVKFDGEGMLLDPISYFLVIVKYLKKYNKLRKRPDREIIEKKVEKQVRGLTVVSKIEDD